MSLLDPQSIAVVGASADEHKVGHLVLKNLLTQGYAGQVYPVNPKGGEILGKEAIKAIKDIKDPVDLAVIVTPAETVLDLVEQCGQKGVQALIIISAGFAEGGEEGKKRETALRNLVKKYTMTLVGPNCLGVMRPSKKLNASFGNILPPPGNVALLSQSGALGEAFIDSAAAIGLGLSLFVSMGNKAAMDECDFLEICAEDPETKVIGLYLESITDGKRFLELARKIGQTKPIVLLKAGTTEKGGKAVSSHTGALAGSDAAVDALCIQGGVLRARTAEHFVDLLRTLSHQPPLPSRNIAVITNAGGPGVLAADAAEKAGLTLASLSPDHEAALAKALPPTASVKNPIDVLGDALADRFEAALTAVAQDPHIDGAVVILTPQVMTPSKEIAEKAVQIRKSHPLFPIVASFMGGEGVKDAVAVLHANGIPNFTSPETAVGMMGELRTMGTAHRGGTAPRGETPSQGVSTTTHPRPVDRKRSEQAVTIIKQTSSGLLDEDRTAQILALYDLPLPRGRVAKTKDEAKSIAKEIGFPVTAKISSKDILHKTDMGGVRINLMTEEAVTKAFDEILRNAKKNAPRADVAGVFIQQCFHPGSEFIVGALKDPGVGHLVMVGLGGVYTELFKDTSFRVAPVSAEEAYPMLCALKSWKLLMGMRGKAPLNVDALAKVISQVSLLVTECPQIKEIDLNPVLVTETELAVLDAKVVVENRP